MEWTHPTLNLMMMKSSDHVRLDPRESQTRSTDYLKKPSMNQHAQQISATTSQRAQQSTQQISAPSRLNLPQSGSENDDETWLTELTGREAVSNAAAEAYT